MPYVESILSSKCKWSAICSIICWLWK